MSETVEFSAEGDKVRVKVLNGAGRPIVSRLYDFDAAFAVHSQMCGAILAVLVHREGAKA